MFSSEIVSLGVADAPASDHTHVCNRVGGTLCHLVHAVAPVTAYPRIRIARLDIDGAAVTGIMPPSESVEGLLTITHPTPVDRAFTGDRSWRNFQLSTYISGGNESGTQLGAALM